MKFSHLLTAKRLEQYSNWVPSAAAYGGSAFLMLIYLTDWTVIADKIPFYNAKFKRE